MTRGRLRLIVLIAVAWGLALANVAPGQSRLYPAPQARTARLLIHGSTDIENFTGVIADYQRLHPGTEIEYVDLVARQIHDLHVRQAAGNGVSADMLISSGMDLQLKLANDGHAVAHTSPVTARMPAWTQWRDEVFGIGYEPVVIAYNTRLLSPARVPRTRRQLLALLADPAAGLKGRTGTFDVEHSGVGYLLATQDHQLGSMAGAVQAALGASQVVLAPRTGQLLDGVASGRLILAYNVLGSYAQARVDAGAPIGIVLPQDYTLVLLRTAMITRQATNPVEAGRFLDYLLSSRGQAVLQQQVGVQPIHSSGHTRAVPYVREGGQIRALRAISLGPGLLVYLDTLKRRQFLDAWNSTMQRPDTPRPAKGEGP